MLATVAVVALGGRVVARARLALRVALRCIKRLPYGTGQGRYRPCWRQHLPAGHPASGRTPSKACSRPSGVQSCYTRLPGPTYLAVFGLLQRTGHHPAWVTAFMRPPARRPRPARAPRPARRPSAAPASWLARYDGCTRCHRGRLTVTAAYPRGDQPGQRLSLSRRGARWRAARQLRAP